MPVMQPQRRRSETGDILTLGGGILGAIGGGGPGGAVAGANIGQTVGAMSEPPNTNANVPGGSNQSQAEAMARRQQQMAQDNLQILKNAEAALPMLPESLRQEYAPGIIRARMMEERARGF